MIDNDDIHRLKYGEKEIIILGTAHVSQKSVDLVKDVIAEEKPDTVCIELCDSRFQALTQKQKWQDTDLLKVLKEKKASLLLAQFMLASIQRKIGKKLGIKPGEEMAQAIRSAEETDSKIHLADRDIRITLARAWHSVSFWEKLKLMAQFIASSFGADDISEEEVEELKNKDMLETLLSEIGEAQPQLKKILIDERDHYLTEKIRNAPGQKVIAVVGAGHVPGIKAGWESSINIDELEKKPPKGHLGSILKWVIPSLAIVLIATGFIIGPEAGKEMVGFWFIANVIPAGVGAALAFAHPITIIVAAAVSPITSLNPMLPAGLVAGIVQMNFSKPKVRDFESLPEDITSIKGFWRNKITKILLVFMLTNLGSSSGAIYSLIVMFMKTIF